MIKNHTINLVLTDDDEVYRRIEKIASEQDVSIETVLEVLVSKGLNQHLEHNLEWAEDLDKGFFRLYKALVQKEEYPSKDDDGARKSTGLPFDDLEKAIEELKKSEAKKLIDSTPSKAEKKAAKKSCKK